MISTVTIPLNLKIIIYSEVRLDSDYEMWRKKINKNKIRKEKEKTIKKKISKKKKIEKSYDDVKRCLKLL